MITSKQAEVFELHCDGCKIRYENESYDSTLIFFDDSELLEYAENDEWKEKDGKWYCEDCGLPLVGADE